MSTDRLNRAISDTLSDLAIGTDIDYIDDVLARTARTRQRPAWTFPGRYLTMSPVLRFAALALLAAGASLGLAVIVTEPDEQNPAQQSPCPSPPATSSPASSPDADQLPAIADCEPWIIYEWFPGEDSSGLTTIKAVRPDGSDAHVVVSGGGHALTHVDWSRDGTRIAFDRWQGEVLDIWTASADGSEAGPLVGCELPCLQLSNPAWSPDDSKLVVQRSDRPEGNPDLERCYLEVIDVASLERSVILEGAQATDTWHCFAQPRWSPDGSSIVFTLDTWQESDGVWNGAGRAVATIDSAGPPDQEPRVLTDPALEAAHPDWHPTDDLIVFGTREVADFQDVWLATNLYTVRADGSELTQVTDYGDGDVRATLPTWTPDGEQIIFNYILPVTRDDWGGRGFAFIHPDGTGLRVVQGVNGHEGRLRPVP